MNKLAGRIFRVLVSLGVLSYLLWRLQASDPDVFERLASGRMSWPRLLGAWSCFASGLFVGWYRWWLIVGALGAEVSLAMIVRLGLLAYMLDFVALGTVGGDVVKAVSLGRGAPERRAIAVSSVLIDRAVGMLCLLTFAALAVAAWGRGGYPAPLQPLLSALILFAVAGWVGVLVTISAGGTVLLSAAASRMPTSIRAQLDQVRIALSAGHAWPRIGAAALLSPLTTLFQIAGFYLIATGLPGAAPTLGEQAAVVPLALLGGVLPLPADNLGVLDLSLSYLYEAVSGGRVAAGQGLLAVMAFRVVGVALTATGAWLYLNRGGGSGAGASAGRAPRSAAPGERILD